MFKKTDVSFSRVCPGIDHKFRHNNVKVLCGFYEEIYGQ